MTSLEIYNNISKLEVAYIKADCIEFYDKLNTKGAAWYETLGDGFLNVFHSVLDFLKDLNPLKDFKSLALCGVIALVIVLVIIIGRRSKSDSNNS